MSSNLAWNEREGVNTVRDITKNTYRLLAMMSDSNPLRVMEFGYTEKGGQLLLYSFLYKHADTHIAGNSLAMLVDEASPSNNTLLINCVTLKQL